MNELVKEFIESNLDRIDKNDWGYIMDQAKEKNIHEELLIVLKKAGIEIPAEFFGLTVSCGGFCIDMRNMPPCLNTAIFDDWLKKFNELIQKIELHKIGSLERNFSKTNINIKFSNEEKKKLYGTLTIEELKDIIRDSWGLHKEIEEILDKIDNYDDYHKLLQELMGAIYRIYPERDCRNPEELHTLLEELEFEMPVLGEYINSKKLIILYVPNIEKAALAHGNISSREFEKVFIHELFHAYHYADDSDELVERYDYTTKVVKESLASAFEWFYCIENKIIGDDELKNSWYKYSVLYYPYSGARHLLFEIGRFTGKYTLDSKKFFKIFDLSLTDMDGALRVLLPYDFYRIKNLICSLTKPTTAPNASITFHEFKKLYSGKTVGAIAKEEIPPIVKKKPFLVSLLLDRGYCKTTFDFDSYTILSPNRIHKGGNYRYYPTSIKINTNDYYICSQWYENQRDALLHWIWINR